jgi:hypothetical protein
MPADFRNNFFVVEINQQRVHVDEYGALMEWQWHRKTEVLGEKCLSDIPSYYKSRKDCLGIEPWLPRWSLQVLTNNI